MLTAASVKSSIDEAVHSRNARGLKVKDAAAARSAAREKTEETPADITFPVGSDTALRCFIALVLVRIGMQVVSLGSRCLSPVHPSRTAYTSAINAWRDSTDRMPWSGFVPTGRWISATQTAWLVVGLLAFNVTLHVLGLPHVPTYGLLRHHVPHLAVHVVKPQ
jgi:hypothetical protein